MGPPVYRPWAKPLLDEKKLIQSLFVAGGPYWQRWFYRFERWRLKGLKRYLKALSTGGWITIVLIAAILIFVMISFNSLFTDFHRIFFSGDSWLFLFSDTLIRLFPMQFWQDAFIWMGVFSLLLAFLLGYFGNKLAKIA